MTLPALVARAYDLFASYTIGNTLDVCKVCCVTDAEEAELVSTPLRQVSRDLLHRAYYESARSGSDRELWEMKHFLPRVLELVSGFEFPGHSTEITFTRLDLNQPEKWQPEEIALLNDFALTFFTGCLGQYPLPGGEGLDDILIMFGIGHFDLQPLLQAWENAATPASLLHLADLLTYGVQDYGHGRKPPRLGNPFSEPFVDKPVMAWLHDAQVQEKLSSQLEELLLGPHTLSEEDASQLSLAYDLLRLR